MSILAHAAVGTVLVTVAVQDRYAPASVALRLESKTNQPAPATPPAPLSPAPPVSRLEETLPKPAGNALSDPRSETGASVPVQLIAFEKPSYPRPLKRLGIEGKVKLRATLLNDGTVESVDVIESSGYTEFDRSSALSLSRAKFRVDQSPSNEKKAYFDLVVRFELN